MHGLRKFRIKKMLVVALKFIKRQYCNVPPPKAKNNSNNKEFIN